MSDAAAEKPAKEPTAAPSGGNRKLLIIVMAVNVLLIGGLAYVIVSNRHQAAAPAKGQLTKGAKVDSGTDGEGEAEHEGDEHEDKEKEEEEEKEEKKGKPGGKFGPLLELGTFVANLRIVGDAPARYAKVNVHVEVVSEEAKARVEAALVPIRSEALLMFSSARPEDVMGQEKISAMGDELIKRANKLIGKKSIRKVYFSELVVQ